AGAERVRLPDVRPRDHDRALLRPGRADLREVAHPRDRQDGRVRPADAGDRGRVHPGLPVLPRPARSLRLRGGDPDLPGRVAGGGALVARPRGGRDLPPRGLRSPGGQADLLGPDGRGRARGVRDPGRPPGAGVGGPRLVVRPGDPLGAGPLARPLPGRPGGGGPHRPAGGAALMLLTLELALAGLIVVVLGVGLLTGPDRRREVGTVVAAGLLGLLVLSL